jgi:C4-type Zn-finger protein
LVNEVKWKGESVYLCEYCGFGYRDIGTADECEEYCDTHDICSQEITKKAIYKPAIGVMSIA